MIFERLLREFEVARASQTQGTFTCELLTVKVNDVCTNWS